MPGRGPFRSAGSPFSLSQGPLASRMGPFFRRSWGRRSDACARQRLPVADVKGPVVDVKGPVADVKGPVSDVKGPVADVKGPVADVKGPVADVKGFPPRRRSWGRRSDGCIRQRRGRVCSSRSSRPSKTATSPCSRPPRYSCCLDCLICTGAANVAHTRQSRPDSGLGAHVKCLKTL